MLKQQSGPFETAIRGPYGTSKLAKVVPLETGACKDGISVSKYSKLDSIPSVMGAVVRNYDNVWIDRKSYSGALQVLTSNQVDPEMFIVSGILSKSGLFTPIKTSFASEGYLTPDTPNGTFAIQAKNRTGQVISSLSILPLFKGKVSYSAEEIPDGNRSASTIVDLPAVPISVSLPYSKEIQSISIVDLQTGKMVYSMEPKASSLESSINSIPDLKFKACAMLDRLAAQKNREKIVQSCGDSSRKVLLVQIAAAAKLAAQKNTKAAKVILEQIRKEILLGVEDYPANNGFDPSRKDIVELIGKYINEL